MSSRHAAGRFTNTEIGSVRLLDPDRSGASRCRNAVLPPLPEAAIKIKGGELADSYYLVPVRARDSRTCVEPREARV
jgi:hypothetical protein